GGFTASFLPVVLTIDEPARITIDPSGTPEVVFQFGPEIVEPGDADLDEELSGSFSTTIGETLELTVLSAAVAEAFPGDTASAAAASQLEVELQLCPVSVLEIPTTDGRGLGFLLLALAVAGLFAVRRLRMG
ncbi:MAG TPA: hypothetical protein VMT16_06910, partial [Thermoanaerobaculia bacterium]|nr:hypothetical protein [Thermoanaerobaculia bacterium]